MGKFEKNKEQDPNVFPVSYKKCVYTDIEKWCIENNQIDWLAETMSKTSEHKIYPNKLDEHGKPIKYQSADGKWHFVKDKAAIPSVKNQPISFAKVKSLFFDKFFPDQKKDPNCKTNLRPKPEPMHIRAMKLAKAKAEAEAADAETTTNEQ